MGNWDVSKPNKDGEPCEDVISRQAALDAIFNNAEKPGDAYRAVRMLASVTPKQRMGHWIIHDESITLLTGETATGGVICSECGYKTHNKAHAILGYPYNYCPNCGRRMVEPQESDHTCRTCKHYTSGEDDGSCGSYICKGYSNWESEEQA